MKTEVILALEYKTFRSVGKKKKRKQLFSKGVNFLWEVTGGDQLTI